jgi:S-formylglutathione hydrolase FrmB
MSIQYIEKGSRKVGDAPPLFNLTCCSSALGGRGDVTVFIPRQRPLAGMAILLHGVCGSHWSWADMGRAHLIAQEMIDAGEIKPLALIMPSDGLRGVGTGYLTYPGFDVEAWITEDVIDVVKQAHPVLAPFEKYFIGGLSMGGYGALRLGIKYPDKTLAISAHSSATSLIKLADWLPADLRGDDWDWNAPEFSLLHWAEVNRDRLPPIRFDCGRDDHHLASNRCFHRDLTTLGIDHTYQEFPGGHTWPYWSEHLVDAICFFNEIL